MSQEREELICKKCKTVMALGADREGDLVSIRIICICGTINNFEFLGYPKLWGTPDVYFNFTDEYELTCHVR